jgi:hypothetical protein
MVRAVSLAKIAFMTFLFLGCFFSLVAADSFICPPNDRIISTGDSMYDVQALCDPPVAKNQRTLVSGSRESFNTIVVDEWTYDLGPNRFRTTLVFHNGALFQVVTGR